MISNNTHQFYEYFGESFTFTTGFPICGLLLTSWSTFLCDFNILFLSVSASGWISLLIRKTHFQCQKCYQQNTKLMKFQLQTVKESYSGCGWCGLVCISFLCVTIYILSLILHPLPEIHSGPLGWPEQQTHVESQEFNQELEHVHL